MVNLILAFDSALAYWSHPDARMTHPYLDPESGQEALLSAHKAAHTRAFKAFASHPLYSKVPAPVDILVPQRGDCRSVRLAKTHCWTTTVPDGAFVPMVSGMLYANGELCRLLLSSPEFCFLQMAQVMDDYELIELGYELCGSYALDLLAESGMVQRLPVTTPKRLAEFVSRATGAPGIQRARRAVKWVLAGSRSPRETHVAMQATLSRSLGGFGVPAPELNRELSLPPEAARVVGASTCIPDMYWPETRTVLEYDSAGFHEGYRAVEHDARKRNVYQLLDLNVISFTRQQFNDLRACTSIFEKLVERHGIKRRPATEKQLAKRAQLHSFLVYGVRRQRKRLDLAMSALPKPLGTYSLTMQLGTVFSIPAMSRVGDTK